MEELKGKKVKCYEIVSIKNGRTNKEHKYDGVFLEWGLDYDKFDATAVSFTTAIVLLDNGTVELIPPHLIQFIKKG